MEVIIYADSLFILSFSYNIILFWLLKTIFYHNCRLVRLAGAALCGALIDTMSPFLQLKIGRWMALAAVLLIFPVIFLFFKENRFRRAFSVWVAYVFLSFSLAGICQLVFFKDTKVKLIDMLALLPAGTIFILVICGEYKKYKLKRPFIYKIRLKYGGNIIETRGFYDTGNGLFEPSTIKPVILLETKLYEEIFGTDNVKFNIPYMAVGTDKGMLEGNELEAVYIESGGGIVVEKVIAARAFGTLSPEGYYRVILHPQLFAEN